ncbi:MAG: hypothetical protein DME60_09325 [Verrucomicrobia bacterium]|nr:MAG: hypothetical protein DME60_09325 [Verrucomicrobiota bacterium]
MEIRFRDCPQDRQLGNWTLRIRGSTGFRRLVEIVYSIAPNYQGKGYATEAATALVDYAVNSNQVKTIRAHTFAEFNPSTRVLEKCAFKKIGQVLHSENNLVWRWEKSRPRSTSN